MKINRCGNTNRAIIYEVLCACGCTFNFEDDSPSILGYDGYRYALKCPDCSKIIIVFKKVEE